MVSERLRYRPVERADLEAFHTLVHDEHVRRYMMDGHMVPREWTAKHMQESRTLFEQRGVGTWLAYDKTTDALVGFCGFQPAAGRPDPHLVYALFERFTGRGLATEMARRSAGRLRPPAPAPAPGTPGFLWSSDMTENKKTVEKYMDGFRKSHHEQILSCLTDDIEWDMPGVFHLIGKAAFDTEIENDAFVGSPSITMTRMTEEHDVVVAEGSVRARRKAGGVLSAVFCDVFVMRGGKIERLITYLMEVDTPVA